jgi:L-lactate utilization protein LutB
MENLPADYIQITLERLRKNGMGAFYYSTAREAAEEILRQIPREATVGVGGSITVREMGIPEALIKRGQKVYDHWQEKTREARTAIGRLQQQSDYFLASTNALTMDGKLINVDASGNRVTSMIFGPSHVIVVAGINKIVLNLEAGLARLKKIAAPKDCQRHKISTPCAQDLVCRDCESPGRLCRVTTIIERKPYGLEQLNVYLIGEELGY